MKSECCKAEIGLFCDDVYGCYEICSKYRKQMKSREKIATKKTILKAMKSDKLGIIEGWGVYETKGKQNEDYDKGFEDCEKLWRKKFALQREELLKKIERLKKTTKTGDSITNYDHRIYNQALTDLVRECDEW